MFTPLYQANKTISCVDQTKGIIVLRFFSHKLVRHNQSHTGEKPYECILCNKAFNQKNNLVLNFKKKLKTNVRINMITLITISFRNTYLLPINIFIKVYNHINVINVIGLFLHMRGLFFVTFALFIYDNSFGHK